MGNKRLTPTRVGKMASKCLLLLLLLLLAQWVVRPTHTRLVPGSKHTWCKNTLVFAMIAS